MKKFLTLFLWLWLVIAANAQETNRGFFVPSSGDCGSISNPVTNGTGCLQTTTANGRDAGTIYVYKGSVTGWVAAFGTGSVTSIATTSPITGGPITTIGTIAIDNAAADGTTKGAAAFATNDFNATTGVISLDYTNGQKATGSVPGFLASADWTTFNAKESALTFSSPLTRSTNTVACQTASASLAGCLSTSDWTTFNAKQAAGNYVTALTGDVTASGPGSVAATIANAAVTYAKIQNVTDARLLGRSAGSAGAPQEITVGTGLSLSAGALTATGQAAGNYITALTGDVTASGPGSVAATIANAAVTYAKIQNVTDARLLGRSAGSSGAPQEITVGTGLSLSAGALTATGGTSGLTLVSLQTVTSDSQTVTFSSLDGNTDGIYLLMGRIKNNAGAATSYGWLPNNLTTNLSSEWSADDGGGVGNSTSQLVLSRDDGSKPANGTYVEFEIKIFAKKNPNSQAFILTYKGSGMNWSTVPAFGWQGHVDGVWNETSTNLTSIVVQAANANGIGNGSTIALYKLAQS